MESFGCVVFLAALVGILVWQFIETRRAVATTTVQAAHPPAAAAQIVASAFTGPRAILWTETSGPGTINMRRRGVRGGITMSITIEPLPSGGSEVDMWASQTNTYLAVLVNFAGVVNRRKKAIARLLASPQLERRSA